MTGDDFHVLVIGEGLAGITAAAAAVSRGVRVQLVSTGPGTFLLGSACVNLHGLSPREREMVGAEQIEEAIAFFVELTASAGCQYKGGIADRRLVPTIMGTFQEISLAPLHLWKGDPRSATDVVVVGIEGLSGFDSNFTAERLSFHGRQIGLDTSYRAAVIKLPWKHGHTLTTVEVATRIDRDQAFRDAFVSALESLTGNAELLIIPGILGMNSSDDDIGRLESYLGCPVCELPTMPPSVPGLRLLQALEHVLIESGVDICTGFAVQKLCMDGNRCTGVLLDTPGRPRLIRADSVVLACGKFSRLLQDCSGQRVLVNRQLQPADNQGAVIAPNLFECGSILENVESRHGNAIAIVTGYRAGMLATEVGVLYAGR
jgi:glycerol-3-phosphate dehydrogenase subunit B